MAPPQLTLSAASEANELFFLLANIWILKWAPAAEQSRGCQTCSSSGCQGHGLSSVLPSPGTAVAALALLNPHLSVQCFWVSAVQAAFIVDRMCDWFLLLLRDKVPGYF